MSQQVDWHGKMTAKAALKLGYISQAQFEAWRKEAKAKMEVKRDA